MSQLIIDDRLIDFNLSFNSSSDGLFKEGDELVQICP